MKKHLVVVEVIRDGGNFSSVGFETDKLNGTEESLTNASDLAAEALPFLLEDTSIEGYSIAAVVPNTVTMVQLSKYSTEIAQRLTKATQLVEMGLRDDAWLGRKYNSLRTQVELIVKYFESNNK